MYNYIPDYLQGVEGLYTGLNLAAWWAAAGIMLIISILLHQKAKRYSQTPTLAKVLNAYSIFFFLLMVNRVFFILSYITAVYNLSLSLGYFTVALGFFAVVYVIEKEIVKQTRFIFSIITMIIVILAFISIWLPDNLATIRDTLQLAAMGPGAFIFILYFFMVKMSTGDPRRKALIQIFGLALAFIGYALDSDAAYRTGMLPIMLAPCLHIVGLIIIGWVLLREEKT